MKKKIIIGVSLGLVVALIATIITLAVVQKSYKPEIDLSPKTVTVVEVSTGDEFTSGVAFANKEKHEEIVELFDESFKQNILGGIFAGNLSNQIEIDLVSNLPSFSEGYKITFEYKADMVLKLNGEKYVYGTNTEKEILFQTIILNVTETEGYQQLSMYAKEVVSNKTYYYEITTIANTQNLYDYLSQLSYQA